MPPIIVKETTCMCFVSFFPRRLGKYFAMHTVCLNFYNRQLNDHVSCSHPTKFELSHLLEAGNEAENRKSASAVAPVSCNRLVSMSLH